MDAAPAGANFLCRHSEQISIAFPWMANTGNSRQARWQNDEAGTMALHAERMAPASEYVFQV